MAEEQTLKSWLEANSLSKYFDAFKENGAESLEDLKGLTDEELVDVATESKLPTIKKKKFIKAVQKLRNSNVVSISSNAQQQQKQHQQPQQQKQSKASVNDEKEENIAPQQQTQQQPNQAFSMDVLKGFGLNFGSSFNSMLESGAAAAQAMPQQQTTQQESELNEDDCPLCKGKGYYGQLGWCRRNDIHQKGVCPLCQATTEVNGKYKQCKRCNGKGGFGLRGSCNIWEHGRQSDCEACNGKGYKLISSNNTYSQQPQYQQQQQQHSGMNPTAYHQQTKKRTCPSCGGKGYYNVFGWCDSNEKNIKGKCALCNAKGEVYGIWEKCFRCKGTGGYNVFGPCEAWTRNRKGDCDICHGAGFTQ